MKRKDEFANQSNTPQTVVESRSFSKDADRLFAAMELELLRAFIAEEPKRGVVIPGSGGVRKLRWAFGGRGKSAGARVVYYYHSPTAPIFLLAVYAKGERVNLSKAETNAMKVLVKAIARKLA